jgi:hypothetical protein
MRKFVDLLTLSPMSIWLKQNKMYYDIKNITNNYHIHSDTVENIGCNISNPTMRTGLDFKSAQFWIKMRGLGILPSPNWRIWNDISYTNKSRNHHLKWGELILIQSKDRINFDPVLGQDQYTSPGIQYYHVSKMKQCGWLIYSCIINEFEIIKIDLSFILEDVQCFNSILQNDYS